MNLILTLRNLEVEFLQQALSQSEFEITHFVWLVKAAGQAVCNVARLNTISERILIFNVHQSFVNLLPIELLLLVATEVSSAL